MQIWRCVLAHEVRWVTLSVQGTACTSCAAAADAVRVGAGALIVFGDYQIAPIAARSTAMGRWRLTPPWYGGTLPAGGTGDEGHLIRQLRGHLSPCESVRGSDTPPACHSIPRTPQGEGFFRPGALLLALFIAFWRCRSGPSGTGETGHRRGLRRGRRSWGSPWHRRPWYRW